MERKPTRPPNDESQDYFVRIANDPNAADREHLTSLPGGGRPYLLAFAVALAVIGGIIGILGLIAVWAMSNM